MTNQFTFFIITCLVILLPKLIFGQNQALHFDGDGDYIELPIPPVPTNDNFTVEFWFTSTADLISMDCSQDFRKLIEFYSSGSIIQVGECNGLLHFSYADNCSTGLSDLEIISNTNIRSLPSALEWHHFAMIQDGNDLIFYLDCIPIFMQTVCDFADFVGWRFGAGPFSPNPLQDWKGHIDQVSIHNTAKSSSEISANKHCPLVGDEENLVTYWTMDEGDPNGNNSSISALIDYSGNGNEGQLNGFSLIGTVSNFVHVESPVIYPNYHNLTLEIRDYPYRDNLLTEICNGAPAHACLYDNGATISANSNISVQWEFSDDGGTTWNILNSPPFTDFCFAIPSGNFTIDCSANSTGSVTRIIRAISTINDPILGESCEQISEEYEIDICCPFSEAQVEISPDTYFCEGENVVLEISLNSPDLFISNPSSEINIEWFYDGNLVASGENAFTLDIEMPTVLETKQFCFEAKLGNCTNKTATFTSCITVDPEPIEGTIIDKPDPATLTLVETNPHLIYEVCPGNDAAIMEDSPFEFCNRQWQYSFTPTDPASWIDMGFSNTDQNTNILPSFQWSAGATSIFYRIECKPLSDPSGCEPVYSNLLEIRLKEAPILSIISGNNPFCTEESGILLSISNPQADVLYSWYQDGILIGGGESIFAEVGGNYQVEGNNGCQTTLSDIFELTECELRAVLNCPNAEGACVFIGDEITLSACDSEISCGDNSSFFYNFSIDGVSSSPGGCEITHTPLESGSTYSVTVTDGTTGCSAVANRTVIPCDSPD